MFLRVITLVLLGLSGAVNAKADKLQLDRYPSTYLAECEGVAYIYQVKRKLRLGLRAVKNCGRIEIDGLVHKMDRYELGYRFETVLSTSDATKISVFSKRNYVNDEFIVGSQRRVPAPENPPERGNQSLRILKACGDNFQSSSMVNYCHETLKNSQLNIAEVASVCAKRNFSSAQKACLQESLKFQYNPVAVMRSCGETFDRNSDINQCYSVARSYQRPPLKILQACNTMYDRNSQKFNCLQRFKDEKRPLRSLTLLQACKAKFSRNSSAETCFEKTRLIGKDKQQTLEACNNGFQRESNKFKCLDLAAKIKVDAAGVVAECSSRFSRTSQAMKCITGFTIDKQYQSGR